MSIPKIATLPTLPVRLETFKKEHPQLAIITSLAFVALGIACAIGSAVLLTTMPLASMGLGSATLATFAISVALMVKVVKKTKPEEKNPPASTEKKTPTLKKK